MSDTIATLEKVREAYDELQAAGHTPSAAKIMARIGGGSKSTVVGHLAAIRAENTRATLVADSNCVAIERLAGQLAQKLWNAAQEQARHEYEAQVRTLTALCTELMNEVAELQAAEEALVNRAEDAEQRLARVQHELDAQCSTAEQLEHITIAVNALKARSEGHGSEPFMSPMLELIEVLRSAGQPIQKDLAYSKLVEAGHTKADAQKARFHAIKSGYVEPFEGGCLALTKKGEERASQGLRKTA